ncbi:LptA/OstA family protein [Rhodoplanes sp. Z2-YC6860]|uniref:LptA/OstA family protein n=1 Tax=Rhodoplanes sp. Z2-YC6860 TaxID=674703 RepID=UPI0009FF0616|nr:LptA/OstA family protein [Rhodoplanes sp. Z2-YC6860]
MLIATAAHAAAQPNANKGNAATNNASPNNNALQGFSQNRNQPVQIEAASLEVRDKEKKATFTGNVKVVQGDTTMRCKSLVVFYDSQGQQQQQSGAQPMKAAAPGPGGSSSISRLEASGGVTVTQKDQVATGERADFDMKTNTVILRGNVVVTQGGNIMRGDRLTVDLTSGVSRVDGSGPVKLLIPQTGSSADGKSGSGMGGLGGLGGMGSKNGLLPGSPRQNSSN